MSSSFAFHFGKFVESTSVKLSTGEFEVGSDWKCTSCAAEGDEDLCADCRESWLHEIRNLNYSDRFERHINSITGASAMVMGLAAGVANSVWGIWVPGNVISLTTETISEQFPLLVDVGDHFANFATALWILSVLTISMSALISLYLLAMNPCGDRHRRHLTGGVFAILFAQMVGYALLMVAGVTTCDIIFVVGPLMMGSGALCSNLTMVGTSEGDDEEDEEEEGEVLILYLDEKRMASDHVV